MRSVRALPLNRFLLAIAAFTAAVLLFWGGESLFHFATLCKVPRWLAWIPAVSTSGVMLIATAIAMNKELDHNIRMWAGSLAGFGILMDVTAAMGQHVLAMRSGPISPSPVWGAVIGGLPPLMGGLLVHVISLVFGQHRREQARAEDLAREAERQRRAHIATEAARTQQIAEENAANARALDHQRKLTAEATRTADEMARQANEATRLQVATEQRAAVAREVLAKPHLVVDNTRKPKAAVMASVGGEQVQAWLMEQHRAGVDYQSIGPAEIARATGAKPETCKSRHKAWKAVVARELELIADLAEAAG